MRGHRSEAADDGLRGHTGPWAAAAQWTGIHSTALGATQFQQWTTSAWKPGSLVWSPFSNLWLYGKTTDVATAQSNGMRISGLGADWSPSGSKSLLGELKVADLHIHSSKLTKQFPHSRARTARWRRCNPADALGWDQQLRPPEDRPARGLPDLPDNGKDPYTTLIGAHRVRHPAGGDQRLSDVRNRCPTKAANAVNPEPIQIAPKIAHNHADRRSDPRRRHALAAGARRARGRGQQPG